MAPETIAEFWDCKIEHSEVKQKWVNENLLHIIRRTLDTNRITNGAVQRKLREMAESQAVQTEWVIDDKILTFEGDSRLGIIAPGAGTAAGLSRVMASDEKNVRGKVRNGQSLICS